MRSYAASDWAFTRMVRLPARCRSLHRRSAPSSLAVIAAVVAEYFGGLQGSLGQIITSAARTDRVPPGLGLRARGVRLGSSCSRWPCCSSGSPCRGGTREKPDTNQDHRPNGRAQMRGIRRRPWAKALLVAARWRWWRRLRHDADDAGVAAARRPTAAAHGELTQVKLQLQWFTQAQFAGYFAAVDQGFYKERARRRDPRGRRRHRAADRAGPGQRRLRHRLGAQGAGLARAGRRDHRHRPDLPALRHLQVSWADDGIESVADLKGKKVGNWGFGNEFELFAGMTKAGSTRQGRHAGAAAVRHAGAATTATSTPPRR